MKKANRIAAGKKAKPPPGLPGNVEKVNRKLGAKKQKKKEQRARLLAKSRDAMET